MNDIQCVSRNELKEYLAGWSDPEQSDLIESHLADCSNCEQTVVALEADPDTLVGLIRSPMICAEPDSELAPILSRARALPAEVETPPSEDASWFPHTNIGAYEILRPLGRGGMGSVFLARHVQLRKEVALKVLPARSFRNEHFTARFQREIRAAGGLDHPAIIRATDAGEQDGTHYLAMEYIDGLDLSQLARLTGPLSVSDACEIIRQAALGLSHAHAQGVVHRDVKPSNLMLSRDGTTKILDFGLARLGPWDEVSADLTTVGQLMGTLDYMAPEQAERADSVDFRGDLYSLGATLFRLLCGRPPLAASPDLSPLAKLRLLATHEPPSLRTLREDAPDALVELLQSLLARAAADRPISAAHLAELLEPFTAGHNLPHLAQRAEDLRASAPEASSLTRSERGTDPAVQTNNTGATKRFSGIGGIGKWLAIALLPLLAWGGIWLTLETQKGQLVIHSEADIPVSIQIRQDDSPAQTLRVEPGNTSTRLYAGKYEIRLESPSDSIQVDASEIVVKRGTTEIATISTTNSGLKQVPPPASNAVLQPGDALAMKSLADPNLEWNGLVTADSVIRVPLIGDVRVAGETLATMQQKLEEKYSTILKTPGIDLFRDHSAQQQARAALPTRRIIPPASTAPLQPGDGLQLTSLVDNALQATVIVQADQTIRVPFLGTVDVSGLTVDQAEEKLDQEYEAKGISRAGTSN